LLFGFFDNIRAKHLAFSSFRPVERGSAFVAIQGLEGGHLKTSLVAIVVGEFSEWQTVLPLGPV
jgi:hypothetical protein